MGTKSFRKNNLWASLMEPMLKQMRVRFSGVDQVESSSAGDRRIPPQKTQPFKEKKKSQNWFQRQLSGQMSKDYDSNVEIEHATAVAAAAFAIKSIEKSSISDKKRKGKEIDSTLVKIKSKKEDTTISKPEPGILSRLFSGTGLTKGTEEITETKVPISRSPSRNDKIPDKTNLPASSIKETPAFDAIRPDPSIKKAPTFAEKQLNNSSSMKPGTSAPILDLPTNLKPGTSAPKLDLPTTMKPATPSNEIKGQSATRPVVQTKADEWEAAEMLKLKKRYEKHFERIRSWEDKKIKKSKLRMEKRESEIEQRRAKAQRKFNKDMGFIKQIAGGARAQAEEWHKNEVLKVREKADTLRRTGEGPTTCCCF